MGSGNGDINGGRFFISLKTVSFLSYHDRDTVPRELTEARTSEINVHRVFVRKSPEYPKLDGKIIFTLIL
jgi:hypothetical protein